MNLDRFDGETFQPEDAPRLGRQLDRVRELMADGRWRTLGQIAAGAGGSEASVSARLRDLRKARHGRLVVERLNRGGGLWLYRVQPVIRTGQQVLWQELA